MTTITASEVNKLRQMTGAGMMDCKNALVEAEGNIDKAIEVLRKKGQKLASKRAERDANEGIILAKTSTNNQWGGILMLSCETDFVAKNQDFVTFANKVIDFAVENKIQDKEALLNATIDGSKVADHVTDYIGKIGEKIEIAHFFFLNGAFCSAYNHHGNRIATLVAFNSADAPAMAEIGKNVAMQIAAMKPIAVDKDGVDEQIVQKEIEIGKDLARQEGKPENIIEKIAVGKLEKFFKENTLLNQEFIKDNSLTVKQYLTKESTNLTVNSFKRLELGV